MLNNNKMKKIKASVTDSIMDEVGKILDTTLLQGACDFSSISREAYATMFKMIKEAFAQVNIKKFPIPRPFHLLKKRDMLNHGMQTIVGNPSHINEVYCSKGESLAYNNSNNLFIDINQLLTFIINFYGITNENVNNKLIVVLKLDESEIIKGQKMERVSLTIMNGALSNSEDSEGLNFSVQSENDIWWLAAFQV